MTATGPGLTFWLLAIAIVAGSLGTVVLRNMVQSALCLALVLLMVGGLYLNLQADLLAGFQVLIYVGAVITLILIAIMLIQNIAGRFVIQTNGRWATGGIVAVGLGGLLLWALSDATFPTARRAVVFEAQTTALWRALLDKYLMPFEIAAVLLLVALLGAIVIAQQTEKGDS